MADLPVPPLDKTLDRYLKAVTPLLTPEELETTTKVVGGFRTGDAPVLYEYLRKENNVKKQDDRRTSYISDDWFDLYLEDRSPLAVNLNPFVVWKDKPNCTDGIARAALFCKSSVDFWNALNGEYLKPAVFHTKPQFTTKPLWENVTKVLPKSISAYSAYALGAYPLDMSQFPQLFHTTRVPNRFKDKITTCSERPGHIILMFRGHMYKLTIMEKNEAVPASQIAARIRQIVASNPEPNGNPLSIFTARANRDTWADTRSRLEEASRANRDSFRCVDSAMFVLSLEEQDVHIDYSNDENMTNMSYFFLHGDGVNRWFDKSFNVVMSNNGTAAVNFEHAWGDGVAVLRYMDDVHGDVDAANVAEIRPAENATEPVQRLGFELDETTTSELHRIWNEWKHFITVGYSLRTRLYRKHGKAGLKKLGIRPDALFQVSFQLAYYKLHQKFESAYESASTCGFKAGRTEAIRGTTIEVTDFCKKFLDSNCSANEKHKAMEAAMKKHHEITVEALKGEGVDRVLFAMRKSGERMMKVLLLNKIPPFYDDPAYAKLGANMISTSTLASDHVTGGGFGPVSPGYGVGYGANDEGMLLNVTSFGRSPDSFIDACHESFEQIVAMVEKAKGGNA